MHKTIFAISSLIFSVGFLIWSIGESVANPQGPNISLGANPIVSFNCNGTGYTVPSTNDYVITDLIGVDSTPNVFLDGVYTMNLSTNGNFGLTTGWLVSSGTTITCSSGTVYMSGYLVHP